MKITSNLLSVEKIAESYHITYKNTKWHTLNQGPTIIHNDNKKEICSCLKEEYYHTGCSKGILSYYPSFITYVYIEEAMQELHFQLIPINDISFKEILWPSPIEFTHPNGYSAIPYMQGILIPNNYEYDYRNLSFDGQFASNNAYMPFWSQYIESGYVLINETYWDCKYGIDHDHKQNKTNIFLRWLPTLGKLGYIRKVKMIFSDNLDYVKAAKIYRQYSKEIGLFTSLKTKMTKLPNIQKLIGAQFIHFGIKTHIDASSALYQKIDDRLITFNERLKQYEKIRQKDHHYYIHLDGWSQYGYDNCHPDILPPCEKAGGWQGLKEFVDKVNENGDMIALHDQYRDYYYKAQSYDIKNALEDINHDHYHHNRWAGGHQNYLCTSLAKDYVVRNFKELLDHNIHVQASYLDVFTCNELDECANILHPMTRKECAYYRNSCFNYLTSLNIISSSEECNDFAIKNLTFSHYGPYEFMLHDPNNHKRMGIPIPLFNLVYHDCFILPWPMEKYKEDMMLYALLNGGAPYLLREGAYPNVDGSFKTQAIDPKIHQERCDIVANFHKEVALEEMIEHKILDDEGKIQYAKYANGISITINLNDNTYMLNN